MKIMKSLLAVSILAAAAQSHATVYNVTGTLDGVNTVGATSDPKLYVHAGSTAYSTTGNQWPSFAGQWDISIAGASGSISGIFSDFVQYATSVNAGILGGTASINQPNLVYSFNGGTVTYNSVTRTFTLGQTMTWSATDNQINNNQSSDATLKFDVANGAVPGVCSGSSTICSGQTTHFLSKPDMERFYLTLTFSPDFQTFTGTAVGADVGGSLPIGVTGNTWYTYSFSGVAAVPVPAAAWLMGSGLLGLAGVARRRRAQS